MASYSGNRYISGDGHKGGDTWDHSRSSNVVTPHYASSGGCRNYNYNINDCKVSLQCYGEHYWAGTQLSLSYGVECKQGFGWEGSSDLHYSYDWCGSYSGIDIWRGGGWRDIDLSRDGVTTTIYSHGFIRSNPPFTDFDGNILYTITIWFERCPKRCQLQDPTYTTRTQTRLAGHINYNDDGLNHYTRRDSRLQEVQNPYSYGDNVIGGWHGDGDHYWFDYTGLTSNKQYELHSYYWDSDYNDSPNNGNQEGEKVRTTRVWTLPTCGSTSLTVAMNTSNTNAFDWTGTDSGTWICNSREYRIRYRINGTSSWTIEDWTSSISGTKSGLTTGKKYDVQIQPRVKGGGGDYVEGSWSSTQTIQLGINWKVTNITCTTREKTALKGIVITGSDGVPAITEYQIRYKEDGSSSWITPSAYTTNSKDITGLSPNTKYNIQARLNNIAGWGDWSSTYNFWTKPSAGTASTSCVKNNTTNSLDIKVNTVETYTPVADTYQIRYKLSTDSTWTEKTASMDQTQTVIGLITSKTYNIQVRARTAVGGDGSSTDWSAWSNSISVRVVERAINDNAEFKSNTSNSVTIESTYTNKYPNVNRIYYALVPMHDATIPTRVSDMYVSTTGSPKSFTVTRDYKNNALTPNTQYRTYIIINQYESGSDWYVAGLDLDSSLTYEILTSTAPEIGTLKNVVCNQNNTTNSLKFHAEPNGTWSVYQGWQYRYKKSGESIYSSWSITNTNDKVIPDLIAGETYDIQIRGSSGLTADGSTYYSPTQTLTVRVTKRPKLTLKINSITETQVKVTATIIDRGYPDLNSLTWYYDSNSYITASYIPRTKVQAKLSNIGTSIATDSCTFTLYKYALYNLTAEARQYKSNADWYVEGLDNKTSFTIENVELSTYSGRTDRLKAYNGLSYKLVDKIHHAVGNTWKYDGQRKDTVNPQSKMLWSYSENYLELLHSISWFYGNSIDNGDTQEMRDIFSIPVPMVDNVRTDISTAYGGNLLPNKINLDLTDLSKTPGIYIEPFMSYTDVKLSKNAFSIKLKQDIIPSTWNTIFSLTGLDSYLKMEEINNLYVEYCCNVIPVSEDSNLSGALFAHYINIESPSSHYGEIIYKAQSTNGKYLACIPVSLPLNLNKGHKLCQIAFYHTNASPIAFNTFKAGTIINISNIGIYYTKL